MTRSKGKLTIIFMSVVICSFFCLTGCKDAEKDKAVKEAAVAKTELAKIKTSLAGIISERDDLKFKLVTAMEARDKLQAIAGQTASIKEKLSVLTKERDAAIAKTAEVQDMVGKLKGN